MLGKSLDVVEQTSFEFLRNLDNINEKMIAMGIDNEWHLTR